MAATARVVPTIYKCERLSIAKFLNGDALILKEKSVPLITRRGYRTHVARIGLRPP
jgi:hypothetical protein